MRNDYSKPLYGAEQAGGLGAMVRWSIERPYVVLAFYTAVLVLSILVIGFAMPRRFMPYVESPLIGIITTMPGMSAEEMEVYISKPIEEQMANIKNVRYIRSVSQDGFSIVTLEFWYGLNMKDALFDVQSLMYLVQSNLPATGANLKPSWVLAIDPLNIPVLHLSLTGEGWDQVKLREFADNDVVNRLKTVPDVYSVVPFGGYRRQLQVIVDRERLGAYGLSILDVKRALDRYNVSRPGGTLTSGPDEAIVRFDTRAVSAEMVENYPVATVSANGQVQTLPSAGTFQLGQSASPRIIYVKDLARVVDTHWERRSAYHFLKHDPGTDGEIIPSIQVAVIQNPEASSWKVIHDVKRELRRIEADNPGIHFEVAYDNAHFVDVLFENMLHELGLAVLLCGIAVFFFLGEWRGTLISMITVPTSLAMAVLGLYAMGMTLNSGTLIGLLLSIGRLVDDTIINVHAVERYLRMGRDAKAATIEGISEVRLAVIASTFMICLALSPLLFCGGIVQLMFVELVWPLILGLLASMFVSFTLTPYLCERLLRPPEERVAEQRFWLFRYVLGPVQRWLDRLDASYSRGITWSLRHRLAVLTAAVATVIIGFGFYHFIGSEMMPLADVGQAYGVVEMAPGTSFEETERAVRRIEEIMLQYPEIERVSTRIGSETQFESTGVYFTGYAVPQVNAATFMITLSDKADRERTIWDVIDGLQKRGLAEVPGIRRFQVKEMGSDVMATAQAPISLIVYGKDLDILDKMGHEVAKIAEEMDVRQVATDWTMGNPDYEVKVNVARAQELGLSVDEISRQAYYALRGGLTNEFYRLPNIRQNTILVRYEEDDRAAVTDLSQLYVTASDGTQVPLSSLATIEKRRAPTLIFHDNLRRVISVNGFYRRDTKPSMDLTMDVQMAAMSRLNFPPGYGIETRGDMTQMMDSFRRLLNGLMLAVLFLFLVLVAQFRGFLQPLQMMLSLPLELSGVFIGLFLAHQAFSTVSVMAVIVLTGMDLTTAILLVDMIMRYRDQGVARDEAVTRACPQRLRPILMTSIITIVVMIPVAFFPKTGMDAYSSLGVVVIGGLIIGTVLSLFIIPIMHTVVDDIIRVLNRIFLRREYQWPVTRPPEELADQGPTTG
ncbi:MAG: efflux RND transporter permease subunit [Armatimonadota bacterium]